VKFSTSNEYAVHALLYVARAQAGGPVQLAEVARVIKVPESYLRKVFQLLAKRGIVTTQRGVKGGVSLSREAAKVTLRDVVEAVDGSLPFWSCLKVQRGCAVTAVCPVKSVFDEAGRKMAEVLEATSLADLARSLPRRAATWLQVSQSA
jgi:Rrf2 family protein